MIIRTLLSSRLRALCSLGMVLGLCAISTMASWSDSASVTTAAFTVGSVDLKLNGQDSLMWTAMNQSDMQPGSSRAASLTVKNSGGYNVTYSAIIAPVTTGVMYDHGVFRVYSGATPVNGNGVGKCSGGTAIGTLEPGLSTTESSAIPTLPTHTGYVPWPSWVAGKTYPWIGTRALAAGQSETLCVWFAVDPDVLYTVDENDGVTAGFTFTATQAN
ncbi:SipW-dependent-type signal peptide-containing protein [Gordonia sp. w5E2]|uniref:SipW-dependent-type signal peptide-containing protein n=1 Tax=Gordonia TaxID=2053 RepID=UPI000ACA582D|nr:MULTISPECIES: SipW-dependent-type signal peptide-containing protein [Gordonia]